MSLSQSEYNQSTHFYNEIMNSFKMDFSLYEDLTDILKPKSVLELGCGMGRVFPIFMKEATEVTGIDLSNEMVNQGRKHYSENRSENTKIEFIHGDICSFSINKKYDFIVLALSVLKHLWTEEQRLQALQNAKDHLNPDGFIAIDQTALLYCVHSTDWIDARTSLVADWVPNPNVLDNYQWKKTIDGNMDILQWRYCQGDKTDFGVKYTTYRYDIDRLLGHIEKLGMNHEQLLTEWGVNGLGDRGKRFIGLITHPDNKNSPKDALRDKVLQRNEQLWSDHDLYTASDKM
ncbi:MULTISPECIES: class I SAM-dependent methyltransferase [unclassified Roseofilum]|uniref:class I SAM-dependent methyltransferase n=1 Tax=unclassified Roseofilum TaxID=2620099 RepID=UPI000E9C3F11|nr:MULTISPECIES: class I SAM-dependent methyltransferase [unclassified Roseofilum]MBP0007778.1 class I SAM-dependent methyltransferase [Roseofilum sp. Belize Diploria]MBP0032171.1 class I SAM-dependent methyltransferase [Roseofilum sp. Belize BBD 4]HBR00615.1 hypothetical protein [Cyanobacteria bacterium UBA11691]